MTVEWILGLLRPPSAIINTNNVGDPGIGNNHHFSPDTPMSGTKISEFRPILSNQYPESSDFNNNNNINNNGPFFRDGFQSDLRLPIFSPGYPAFFILILLVSLTTFAIFLLLFLCCLDAEDFSSFKSSRLMDTTSTPEPEPEPPFKDAATETEDPAPEPEAVEDDGDATNTDSEVTELTEVVEADIVQVPIEDEAPPP